MYFFSHRYPSTAATTDVSAENTNVETACDDTCQQWIVEKLQDQIPTPVQREPTIENKQILVPKEYVIPLGSGATKSKEWEFIPSIEATIDTRNYPPIKSVVLETYLSIPTANGMVYAKLYNVTDKHDVWFSEVSMEADKVLKKTATIKLEPGSKLYRIMMKSSLGYEAILENAKLRIITE